MPRRPVTEQQILDAIDELSENWVEQLARRAKNQRTDLSDEAICRIGECLDMPGLVDELVKVRLSMCGPLTTSEMDPPTGTPSIAEFCTPQMVCHLLGLMQGDFDSDAAYHFVDYHLSDWDDDVLEAVVAKSRLARSERDDLLFGHGYSRGEDPLLAGQPKRETSHGKARGRGAVRAVLVTLGTVAAVIVALAGGILVVGAVAIVAVIVAVAVSSSGGTGTTEKFPDQRSDYNRRVWADDHDFSADGDTDHNWEADGDRPW